MVFAVVVVVADAGMCILFDDSVLPLPFALCVVVPAIWGTTRDPMTLPPYHIPCLQMRLVSCVLAASIAVAAAVTATVAVVATVAVAATVVASVVASVLTSAFCC